MSSQNVNRCDDLWVADLMILRHGLKWIKDPEQLRYWAEKRYFVNHPLVIAHQEQLDASRKRSVARERNGVAPTPQSVSTTALKDAAPVKPSAKLLDSDDDEFLVKALELGTADNAVLSRDDGTYGNGAVDGNGDDDDVGKDDDDTLILSSDDQEMQRCRE